MSKELSSWNGGKQRQCAQYNLCRNIRAAAEIAPEDKSETGRQWERKYIHIFKRILKRWPEFRGYIYFTNNKASSETINAFPHVPFLTPIFSLPQSCPLLFSLRSMFRPQHLKIYNKHGSHIKCGEFVSLFSQRRVESITVHCSPSWVAWNLTCLRPENKKGRWTHWEWSGRLDVIATALCPRNKTRVWSNLRPPRKPTEEGNGNPLQYSCLENPMDRGSWQVARVEHNLATTPPPPRKSTHKFFTKCSPKGSYNYY